MYIVIAFIRSIKKEFNKFISLFYNTNNQHSFIANIQLIIILSAPIFNDPLPTTNLATTNLQHSTTTTTAIQQHSPAKPSYTILGIA